MMPAKRLGVSSEDFTLSEGLVDDIERKLPRHPLGGYMPGSVRAACSEWAVRLGSTPELVAQRMLDASGPGPWAPSFDRALRSVAAGEVDRP
jgi:hypothetical protein